MLLLVLILPSSHSQLLSCVATTHTLHALKTCMGEDAGGEGKKKKKVRLTPRAREVTGTTTNPRAVPMETSVAAYNEGERERE